MSSTHKRPSSYKIPRIYLTKFREAQHLTLVDTADQLGISTNYYSMLESGARGQEMKLRMVIKMIGVYKIDGQQLINEEMKYLLECEKFKDKTN